MAPISAAAFLLGLAGVAVPSSDAADVTATPPTTFGAEIATGVIGRPDAVAFADVTGDGRGDVLVTTRWRSDPAYDRKLWVVPGTASGGLAEPVVYPTHSEDPSADNLPLGMASGDVDGDGDQDAVVAIGTSGIDVFLQENGSFGPPAAQPMAGRPRQLVLHDMDVDGDLDLVFSGDTLSVAYNDGTGVFESVRTVHPKGVFDFEVGEFTGDTTPDLAACESVIDAPSILVFGQEPGGTFSTHPEGVATNPAEPCGGLAVADLNGDNADDVAVSRHRNQPESVVTVWQQQADHSLAPSPPHHVYEIPGTIEAADMNGDGLQDLVVVHDAWPALGVLRQTPAGDLEEESLQHGFSFVGEIWAKAMTTGDVTNDGLPDVIASNSGTTTVLPRSGATIETVADVSLVDRHITYGEEVNVTYRVDPVGQSWPADPAEFHTEVRSYRRANKPWELRVSGPATEPSTVPLQHPVFTTELRLVYSGAGAYLPSEDTETLVVHSLVTQQMLRSYDQAGRYALYHLGQIPQTRATVRPSTSTEVRTVVQRRLDDGTWATIRERSIALDGDGTASWRIADLRKSGNYRVRTTRPADAFNGRGTSGWEYFRITS